MALHSTAQGLATLGRHGDSVLVHMQPQEVAGLQALAKSQGTSLTVNPNTGMPEAFNLGNFFSSLLPTLAGFMVGGPAGASLGLKAGTTAATLAPIAAGVATGAAVAGAKGDDILGGALMGGLGGYGGGNLGSTFGKMGAQGGYQAGQAVGPQLTAEGGLSSAGSGQGMMNTLAAQAPPSTYMGGLNQMGSGFGELFKTGGYDKFVSPEIGGSAMQLGSSLGLPVLSAMQPEPYDFAADEAKRKAEENKYRDPITGRLNLNASSGLNLTGFAMGGQVDSNPSVGGGISDLYNRPEGATTQSISSDGYGMSRLDRLSQEGSHAKAADMFYAQGGPVSFADGGDTGMNLDQLPSLNVNTGEQNAGGQGGEEYALKQALMNAYQKQSPYTRTLGGQDLGFESLLNAFPSKNSNIDYSNLQVDTAPGKITTPDTLRQALALAGKMYEKNPTLDFAQGGPVSFADGGDTGMNVEGLGSLNVNTGMQSGAGMGAGRGEAPYKNLGELMFESMYRGVGPETVRKMLGQMTKAVTQNVPKSYALNVNSGQQEAQYARGGYLNGQGDGMSDSIPATIEGKQPARLADGEFVVPADVVSHLGNGSSKAGSKRLYMMLDKVRHARTGNKKQGREINPAKYMPA